MALTATNPHFLEVPRAPTSRRFMQTSDDVDNSFNVDLETSFASNVSLNSPPRDSMMVITPDYEGVEPMDISPCPAPRPAFTSKPKLTRPRAFTTSARLFGRDVSNGDASQPEPPVIPPASKPTSTVTSKRIQRSDMPAEWTLQFNSTLQVHKFPQVSHVATPASPIADDAMDVDSPLQPAAVIYPSFSAFDPHASNAPAAATFSSLFFDSNSPQKPTSHGQTPGKKTRRSLSPDSTRKSIDLESSIDLSSDLPSSPSERRLHRVPSGPLLSMGGPKPSLQSLGMPSGLQRGRRQALLSMHPDVKRLAMAEMDNDAPVRPGATRRAFSARLPPAALSGAEGLPSDPDNSFDLPDGSSPAQAYAQRQQAKAKTLRRCDNFKAPTIPQETGMQVSDSPSTSRFLKAGMPGFGDNESHGKLLPCHRVSEDGLMRIVPETLDMLLDGKYDSQIAAFYVIDCRFDYEYNGGHVPGAINVRSTEGLEDLFLGPNALKPIPSVSGDKAKKTILVFHCEFSAKRAPTFAKHLRSKDRAANNHNYPKIHYPEIYILEGGYCRYFKASGARCQPPAYVPMDDPQHKVSAKTKMDLFERKTKFGRTKSYAYGDLASSRSLSSRAAELHQQKQAVPPSAPSGSSLFAAANIRPRKPTGTTGLSSMHDNHSDDDDETDIGDSPCPQPNRPGAFKPRKLSTARPLMRAETFDPSRLGY